MGWVQTKSSFEATWYGENGMGTKISMPNWTAHKTHMSMDDLDGSQEEGAPHGLRLCKPNKVEAFPGKLRIYNLENV